jgi:hypothetical protein
MRSPTRPGTSAATSCKLDGMPLADPSVDALHDTRM